jgi:hypothetical protein
MAFARRPVMSVVLTVEDKQRPSTSQFYVEEVGGLLPDLNDNDFAAFLTEFASSYQNATDCVVTAISVGVEWIQQTIPAFGTSPNVERKGILQFRTEDGFYSTFSIAGIKDSAIAADGTNIVRDPSNPSSFTGNAIATHLQSLHDKLVNGATIDLVTFPVTDRRGSDLVSLADAYQQHRANSRG